MSHHAPFFKTVAIVAQGGSCKNVAQPVPFTRLPPELMSRIFLLAQRLQLQQEYQQEPQKGHLVKLRSTVRLTSTRSPFQHCISRVCSGFRDVALRTAPLWTSIFIAATSDTGRIQTYLERSSAAMLNVYVYLDQNWLSHPDALATLKVNLAPVLMVSNRWRRLHISCSRDNLKDPNLIPTLCNSFAPNLEELYIQVAKIEGIDTVTGGLPNFAVATIFTSGPTNIRDLRLHGLAVHFFRPPMVNLKVLEILQTSSLPIPCSQLRCTLMEVQELVHLSVGGSLLPLPGLPALSFSDRINLPRLESLQITGDGNGTAAWVLSNMAAPLMRVLILKDVQDVDLDHLRTTPGADSFPQLQVLDLYDMELSDGAYRILFASFPLITHYSNSYCTLDPDSSKLARLLVQDTRVINKPEIAKARPPWPDLRVLTFGFDARVGADVLKKLLGFRKGVECPLKELRFVACDVAEGGRWLEDVDLEGFDSETLLKTQDVSGQSEWPLLVEDLA